MTFLMTVLGAYRLNSLDQSSVTEKNVYMKMFPYNILLVSSI